jgi:large subunit ribosomal protein L7/L12
MPLTQKDLLLLVSLALNVLLLWRLARRGGAALPESLPSVEGESRPPPPSRPVSAVDLKGVRQEMRNGNLIQAIKLYRQLTGCGLADAKHAVEALERE